MRVGNTPSLIFLQIYRWLSTTAPKKSLLLIDKLFTDIDFEVMYRQSREDEKKS